MECPWNTHWLNAEGTMTNRPTGISSLKEDMKITEYIRDP